MKLGAHDIMIMAWKYANASSALPVPYANRLIVGSGHDPRILVVEHCRADIIQMTQEGENAALLLVVPYFDFVIVTAGNEKWLLVVETNAPHWTIMLIVFLQQSAHPVVPQLDCSIVQTSR